MDTKSIAQFLIEHGATGLMAIGVALLVTRLKSQWFVGPTLIVLGGLWFSYQAWEARNEPVEVVHTFETSRDQMKTNVGYDDKTALYYAIPQFEHAQVLRLSARCLRGACQWVYPCPDGGKCSAMHQYYRDVKKLPQRYIQEDRPTPYFGTCEGSWEALSNGDNSAWAFDVTYKRRFVDGDAQYTAWKKNFPLVYLLINLIPVQQPC